jgi:hypothetical protein
MPRIHNDFLECSIYIYPSKEAAEKGVRAGGSGCLVLIKSPVKGYSHAYAVTNSHVIREGNSSVIRLNTIRGEKDILEFEYADWIHHPDGDDLAVCPIDFPSDQYSVRFIDRDKYFITDTSIRYFDIGVGDQTFMVGRFISHEGKQRNTPSVRFGNIAMMPNEPVRNTRGYMQESFLVETRSIGGYSGSPVFVYIPNYENRFPEEPRGVVRLLGIDWGHLPFQSFDPVHPFDKVVDASGTSHPDGWRVASNTGMAAVVPAWKLDELLNIPELLRQREQEDEELLEKVRTGEITSPAVMDETGLAQEAEPPQ